MEKLSIEEIIKSLDGEIAGKIDFDKRVKFLTDQFLIYTREAHNQTLRQCLEFMLEQLESK